ncbi:ABC transporter ATP-binding protein [Methanoculleus palmolei]|jgi:ATP-binding cassette subfamily B protein|uniref:ABC transporter ATP-binding protein n=2 Tax=Methanoculleus TaxID=45989 RepID=A0ABD8AAZ1_9EURY|nr:ABC transporter ATP-binding protein [Methanoculleus sp. UBA377]WOX56688.1 ABC transporter ATP-binding protein [Methanoculleus palmolei]
MKQAFKEKTGIMRLLEIAGEKKGLLICSGILSMLSAVFMLVPYVSVYYILAELLRHAADLSSVDGPAMIRWGWIALWGLVAGLITMYLGGMASHIAAFRILYGLRVQLTEHIGRLPLGYLTRTSIGAVKKTLEQNVEKIEQFVAHQIPDMCNALATVVVMFAALFYLNFWMALVCLTAIALGFGIQASMWVGEDAKKWVKLYYDALEEINASAVQYVRGMPAVKVFGQTVHSFRRFYDDMVRYRDFCVRFSDSFQNGFAFFKTILASLLSFILPVGVLLLSRDPAGMAFALVLLFFVILGPGTAAPLYKFLYLSSSLRDISEGVDRIDAVFAEPTVPEPEQPRKPETYSVEFDGVSFSYDAPGASTRVEALSGISFTAEQGKVTALVGPSGSGKTTVANLIPRFWDVGEGAVRIGGVDVRRMRTEDLMDTVSFVFQDTFLFFDTLYENIRVGKPGASREEVYAAARAAQCHDFIERLPKGYDTLIGEGGVYLSGGEEQRVSVARAILKGAPILVLDEATAFADPENEYKMQMALRELVKEKTVIVIAHRLSSIRGADQILVLEEGHIAERGTHEELLREGGVYRRMWDAYTDAASWVIEKGGVA